MNTMKRDDMLKERHELTWAIGSHAIHFLVPFCNLMSGVARWMYLEEEIKKVAAKPQVVKEEPKAEAEVV